MGFQAVNGGLQQPRTFCCFDDILAVNEGCEDRKLTKEEQFLRQLNPQMRKIFEGLTPEGKALAMELGKTDEEKSEPH